MRWLVAAVLVLFGASAMAGISSAAPAMDPAAPSQSCSWQSLGQTAQQLFHRASAMDTTNNIWYLYGGLNQSNQVDDAINSADLSNPMANPTFGSPSGLAGVQNIFGAAGAYRAAADPAQSAIYWTGGAGSDGDARNIVQVFMPAGNTWQNQTVQGFSARMFHAAVAVPDRNAIVVYGGVKSCDAYVTPQPSPFTCDDSISETQVIKVDPTTGALSVVNIASTGPGQRFGHTMVYDSAGQRILLFGGTDNGASGKFDLFAMDVSDPSESNWAWAPLTTGGTRPSGRYFHTAAYDTSKNMMVVAGGATTRAFETAGGTAQDTFGLDLGQTPPTWRNLSAPVSQRVGGNSDYSPSRSAVILHGGRTSFNTAQQTVKRDVQQLSCQQATPVTPTTPSTPGTTPTTPVTTPGTPGTVVPTVTRQPTGIDGPFVCDAIANRVPAAAINAALSDPTRFGSYQQPANPGLPIGPFNPPRVYLSLRNAAVPYHPLFNPLVFKSSCP
jgi:hypothetical protein